MKCFTSIETILFHNITFSIYFRISVIKKNQKQKNNSPLKIDAPDGCSLSMFGTDTSIKRGMVKLDFMLKSSTYLNNAVTQVGSSCA